LPVRADKEKLAQHIKSANDRIRFIYLVEFSGDQSPTLISALIRFKIANRKFIKDNAIYATNVFTYNSLRDSGRWPSFEIYQEYHSSKDIKKGKFHEINEWFHVTPGFGDSKAWEWPRRFFAVGGGRGPEEGIYSYLTALAGLRPSGTCTDMRFVLPKVINSISFTFRNLRQRSGFFLNPDEVSVEF